MLEVRSVSKSYGHHEAVDALSFTVHPGVVTGFLGPNGAVKSTTMRMALGLTRPDAGDVLVGGRRYFEPAPVPWMLPTWTALAALIGYAVAPLALAADVVRRRDL